MSSSAADELDARLARIAASLSELRVVEADAREEILTATEQLLGLARTSLEQAVTDSNRARSERGRPRQR